jgi:hypothetical protein
MEGLDCIKMNERYKKYGYCSKPCDTNNDCDERGGENQRKRVCQKIDEGNDKKYCIEK